MSDVREETSLAAKEEDAPPRSRWGVGYIAGVGPTELVEETPQFELVGTLPVRAPLLPTASRDYRGLVSLALATMILVVVGVAWSVTTSSGRATVQTTVKPVPPPAQHAPSTQVQSTVPYLVSTQPHDIAPAAGPVRHSVPIANSVAPPPAAQAPAQVVHPQQPPATGDNDHHFRGEAQVGHHDGDAAHAGVQNSDDEGH